MTMSIWQRRQVVVAGCLLLIMMIMFALPGWDHVSLESFSGSFH